MRRCPECDTSRFVKRVRGTHNEKQFYCELCDELFGEKPKRSRYVGNFTKSEVVQVARGIALSERRAT